MAKSVKERHAHSSIASMCRLSCLNKDFLWAELLLSLRMAILCFITCAYCIRSTQYLAKLPVRLPSSKQDLRCCCQASYVFQWKHSYMTENAMLLASPKVHKAAGFHNTVLLIAHVAGPDFARAARKSPAVHGQTGITDARTHGGMDIRTHGYSALLLNSIR